jgi:hypothetical protein
MAAWDLLASVRAEHEERPSFRGFGERWQQLQCRRVRPLKIVEEDDGRLARRNRLEGAPERFEERFTIGHAGRGPELG